MLKLRLLSIAFFLTITSTFAQDANKKTWDADSPLQWSDFQGPVDPSSSHTATTFSGMSYSWHRGSNQGQVQFTFTVTAYMERAKSWVREGRQTAPLLTHERLHFDISEFFARKLTEALNSYAYTNDYRNEITRIYEQLSVARKAMEVKYDEQANHGLNKVNQAVWELYVADLLAKNYTYEQALAKEPGS